jgi:hypothetical protein
VKSRFQVGLITYLVADQVVAYFLCDSNDMHRAAPPLHRSWPSIPQYDASLAKAIDQLRRAEQAGNEARANLDKILETMAP